MANKLYVGNLAFTTTEDTLRAAFAEYGDIVDCTLEKDRDTQQSRGFGFVTYPGSMEARNAVEGLDNCQLDGRSIKVNLATARGGIGGRGYGQTGRQV